MTSPPSRAGSSPNRPSPSCGRSAPAGRHRRRSAAPPGPPPRRGAPRSCRPPRRSRPMPSGRRRSRRGPRRGPSRRDQPVPPSRGRGRSRRRRRRRRCGRVAGTRAGGHVPAGARRRPPRRRGRLPASPRPGCRPSFSTGRSCAPGRCGSRARGGGARRRRERSCVREGRLQTARRRALPNLFSRAPNSAEFRERTLYHRRGFVKRHTKFAPVILPTVVTGRSTRGGACSAS